MIHLHQLWMHIFFTSGIGVRQVVPCVLRFLFSFSFMLTMEQGDVIQYVEFDSFSLYFGCISFHSGIGVG